MPLPADYADMKLGLPASSAQVPILFLQRRRDCQQHLPLGFILGDEGSGAVLGKLLVGDILKNQLPPAIKEAFLKQFDLTAPEIIDRVYRQPFPNRFLASLSPFIAQHLEEPGIRQLVLDSLLLSSEEM